MPVSTGGPSGNPVTLMSPDSAWITTSYAPARTPAAVVAAANAAINAAIKEKAVIDSLAVVGLIAKGSTPGEMQASQQAEFERWGPLVKKVGFTAES